MMRAALHRLARLHRVAPELQAVPLLDAVPCPVVMEGAASTPESLNYDRIRLAPFAIEGGPSPLHLCASEY